MGRESQGVRSHRQGTVARELWPSAWRLAVAYGVPVATAVAATATWFSPGRFFAIGDLPPYLHTNLAGEIGYSWNHQFTGAGSISYAIIQAPDVALLEAARMLGASPMAAQQALYALVAGLVALGAAYLARAWVSHPIAGAAAGLLGGFNAFMMVTYPNHLFALAIGLIGLLAGMVLRAAQGRSVSPLALAAATLPVSYLAQNPPLLAVVGAAVTGPALLGRLLAGRGGTSRALVLLARAMPWIVLFNAWWLVPYAHTLIARDAVTITAQTDVVAWAWTHRRSSLPNVLTLNAVWGWDFPEYYPFNKRMDAGVGPLLRWLPLTLAVSGVLLADRARRRPAWTLVLATAVAAFLTKGVHEPLGWVNLWLYENVPGMWLFREPTTKFGVLMVLAYAALAALAVQRVFDLTVRRPALSFGALRVPHPAGVTYVALLAAVVAALAYPWPLWTGDVAPREPGGLPSARVAVPPDWQRLADKVDGDPAVGKLLTLPLDTHYQINTNWGYHGTDTIPTQMIRRPVLQRIPGTYFGGSSEVDALLAGVENALVAGDVASLAGPLRVLGVSHVLIRHDLSPDPHLPPPADVEKIEAALRKVPQIAAFAANSMGALYRYTGPTGPLQIQQRLVGSVRDTPADAAAALARLDDRTAVTTQADLPTSGVNWQTTDASGTVRFTVDRAGSYRISRPTETVTNYRPAVQVDQGTGNARLTLTDAQTTRVDGNPLPSRPSLEVRLNRPDPVGLVIDGRPQELDADRTLVSVGTSTQVAAYAVSPQWASVLGDFADVGDCNDMVRVKAAQADQQLTRAGSLLSLTAIANRACTWAPVRFVASRTYRVQLSYRTHGGPARVCLWQEVPDRCAEMPALAAGADWQQYTAVVRAESEAPTLRLYLYADGGPDGAAVEYRDVSVAGLEQIGQAVLTADDGPEILRDLAAGEHRVDVQSGGAAPRGGMPLQECSGPLRGLVVYRPDGAVELSSARSDNTCVATHFHTAAAAGVYVLSLDYKTVSGSPPRGWLVQEGPNSSANLPSLSRTHDWKTLTTMVRVAPDVRDLALYLFADAGSNEPSTVAYRNVRFTRAFTTNVLVSDVGGGQRDTPTVSLSTASPTVYKARIRGAGGPFVLTLAESYASGWRIRGLPHGWHAIHFRGNGYANGWLISGVGDATISVEYQPQHWAQAAIVISGGAAAAVVLLTVLRWIRRRRGSSNAGIRRPGQHRTDGEQQRGAQGPAHSQEVAEIQ